MITPPADGLADGPMDIDTIPMLVVQAIRAARAAADTPAPLPGLGAPGPLEAHLADYPLPVLHLLGVLYIIGRQGQRPDTLAGLLAGPAQAWPTVSKAAAALARKRHLADCLSRALVEIGPGDLEAFFGEA